MCLFVRLVEAVLVLWMLGWFCACAARVDPVAFAQTWKTVSPGTMPVPCGPGGVTLADNTLWKKYGGEMVIWTVQAIDSKFNLPPSMYSHSRSLIHFLVCSAPMCSNVQKVTAVLSCV
jgi:hypothetical protein